MPLNLQPVQRHRYEFIIKMATKVGKKNYDLFLNAVHLAQITNLFYCTYDDNALCNAGIQIQNDMKRVNNA